MRHKHALKTLLITLWDGGESVQAAAIMSEASIVARELGSGEELAVPSQELIVIVGAPCVSLSGVAEGYGRLIEANSSWPMANETTSVASTAHST